MKLSSTNIVLSNPILANQNTLYIENRLAVSPVTKKKERKTNVLEKFYAWAARSHNIHVIRLGYFTH